MKTFVGLFVSSGIFGLVIAVAYFIVAHREATGTVLLGCMTAALAFAAGFALLAERDAHLDGDDEALESAAVAGEDLGVFTTATPLPIIVAFGVALGLLGLLYSPLLAVGSTVLLVWCLWRLGSQSARV